MLQPNVLYVTLYANFVSGMLIVIMAVDRCLSVVIPLKASSIFSFRRMLAAIVFTYLIILAGYAPTFFLYTVKWVTDPQTKRATAFFVPVDNYAIDITIPGFITTVLTLIVKPVSILIVVLCSVVTVVKLKQATKVRSQMSESQSQVSQSEAKITKMLLLLSVIYIICILPDACGALINYFIPDFFLYRKYHNIFVIVYETIFAGSCLNSSANFFAYLWLSSKFRTTLLQVAPCFKILFSTSCCSGESRRQSSEGSSAAAGGLQHKNDAQSQITVSSALSNDF
nr:hypothetical protein BaRGS_001200 [Batillaria attramentaria]